MIVTRRLCTVNMHVTNSHQGPTAGQGGRGRQGWQGRHRSVIDACELIARKVVHSACEQQP
jgi:hypothetical protein